MDVQNLFREREREKIGREPLCLHEERGHTGAAGAGHSGRGLRTVSVGDYAVFGGRLGADIRKWGFTYKTCAFTWVKQNRKSDGLFWGLGFWTRANAELCLLATRGRPKRVNKGVHSVVLSHVREHSRKPDEVRDRIVELMGDIPRIELFARQQVDGWDCWGDEV